jgi:hypothetical protein
MIDSTGWLRRTSYDQLASSGSDERLVVLDFALSSRSPRRFVLGHYPSAGPSESSEPG